MGKAIRRNCCSFSSSQQLEQTFTQKISIIENEMEGDSPNTGLLHEQSFFVSVPLPDQVCIDHCRYTTLDTAMA